MAHPQLVGNSFVSQYYNVLHQSPQVVHRFYTDSSSLTRAEAGPNGHADTVFSQSGIHDKVMQLDYAGLRAEIRTVDCQDSYSGSVLVMVTGSLSTRSNERRDFVQTFFLAPQAKGYFVLNDIFRYLDEPHSSYAMANGVQEHSPTPESAVSDPAHVELSETVAPAEQQHVDEGYDVIPQQEDVEEEEVPVEETVQMNAVALESEEAVDLDDGLRDAPKKSYASIASQLRVVKDGYVHHASPKPAMEKPVSHSPQAAPLSSPALPPPMETVDETAPQEVHVDGKAIYIKNLPMTITVPQLEEEFQKFGAVKAGFTNIKRNPSVCYAFLEFEDAAFARAALQASPIQIMGKNVHVEEKRPLAARGGGGFRGRGRGRTDGGRGRGGYYGGRGGGNGGGRGYETSSNRGRGRGAYGNAGNSNNNSGGAHQNQSEEPGYHPRYDNNNNSAGSSGSHNSGNAGLNNNSSSGGGNNSGSGGYSNGGSNSSRPARRNFFKNNSYGRGGGGHHPAAAAPAPAAVTAA